MQDLMETNSAPSGGWWHVEKHSGIRFPDKGIMIFDYNQLVGLILKHRKATGGDLEIGWEGRFQEELCEEHPEYPCKFRGTGTGVSMSLADVKQFLYTASKFIDGGGQFVDQQTADSRASICAKCPKNVPVTGCFGCAGIANAAMDFIANRKTASDEKLQNCEICHCFLRVKVWMPEDSLVDGQEYPDYCWQNKDAK